MATTKNLCAQIPIDLHERVSEERERLGQTTSEYIANLIQDYDSVLCRPLVFYYKAIVQTKCDAPDHHGVRNS